MVQSHRALQKPRRILTEQVQIAIEDFKKPTEIQHSGRTNWRLFRPDNIS